MQVEPRAIWQLGISKSDRNLQTVDFCKLLGNRIFSPFGKNHPGMHIRDMMQISSILDNFQLLNRPLYITNVGVPGSKMTGLQDGKCAGIWHAEWDQLRQSQWIEAFYKIALSKPFVDSIVYSNLTDRPNSVIADSGLMTDKMQPKKSHHVIKKLHDMIYNR